MPFPLVACVGPRIGSFSRGMFAIYPAQHYKTTITVSAGHIRVEEGFDKVSSLMTGLDYDISRAGTINGLAISNYYRECVPDFGEKICDAMAKKHQTNDQQIYHPDNGLGINFFRVIDSEEVIGVHVLIKGEQGAIKIIVDFDDAFQDTAQTPSGYSKAAVNDFSKMVASFTRSYGADRVSAILPH